MAEDFTRVNFGWRDYYEDTQPNIFEYGTSKAASWDCPVTLHAAIDVFAKNPRTADTFEVMRRWEDVRAKNWLTSEQKELKKNPDQEYILLIDEQGEYELVPYEQIEGAAGGNQEVRAFVFERKSRNYVVCWHTTGNGRLILFLDADNLVYENELGGEKLPIEKKRASSVIDIEKRRYLSTTLPQKVN